MVSYSDIPMIRSCCFHISVGMHGCGTFGVPILDTSEERFRVYFFVVQDAGDSATANNYEEIVMKGGNKKGSKKLHAYSVVVSTFVLSLFGRSVPGFVQDSVHHCAMVLGCLV